MPIQERIKEFIDYKGLTYKSFESACGFGNGTAKRFNEKIKQRTIDSIISTYPELNQNWLMTGEGEMLNKPLHSSENFEDNGSTDVDINLYNSKNTSCQDCKDESENYMEIIRELNQRIADLSKQIHALNNQIEKKDDRIQQLTDIIINSK